jgi:hypothetical protein
LTLAERRRGNASNEKSASHKARTRATRYTRPVEQFKSAPRQTLELCKR